MKRVVVIGSGVGGAAAAALLAQRGHRVMLFEAHSFSGGRCATFEREGFRFDFGVHMFSRGDTGPHGIVNRKLDGDLRWIIRDPACRVVDATAFDFPLDIRPLSRRIFLARQLGVCAKNLIGAFRLFRSLMGGMSAADYDHMRLQDYVSRFTDDERIHLFINCLSQLYFALSYDESSAGEFIWCFSHMFSEASFGYPRGGAGEIPNSFIRALVHRGGEIRSGEPVKRIRVENGAVRGVETAEDLYPADMVISNAGIGRTVELAGREQFPGAYLRQADVSRPSHSYVTIKYALERPVVSSPVVFVIPRLSPEEVFRYISENRVPDDPYIFMPVPSNLDPSLAPTGRQLAIAGTAAPAGASAELCNRILDRVHARVCELFPAIDNALLWQVRSITEETGDITGHPAGEAIGLAQTPEQVGALRPGHETPVAGLWLVGADAGARGIGTEMASGSALNLLNRLEKI